MKTGLLISFVIVVPFAAWYINDAVNEHKWSNARLANTIEAYEEYVRNAPERHQWKGAQAIGELRWKAAQQEDTIGAYKQVLASSVPYEVRREAEKRLLARRAELDRACAVVLQGTGVPQADGNSARLPRRLVLLGSDGKSHDWSKQLREEWKPGSLSEVDLVAVLDPAQESVIEVVPYQNGPSITRYACSLRVRLFRAKDGTPAGERLFEDIARHCQPSERYDLVRLGYPISFGTVESWLKTVVDAKTETK